MWPNECCIKRDHQFPQSTGCAANDTTQDAIPPGHMGFMCHLLCAMATRASSVELFSHQFVSSLHCCWPFFFPRGRTMLFLLNFMFPVGPLLQPVQIPLDGKPSL